MQPNTALKAAAIVRDAGGRIVGRTRLQKVAYLLSAAGLEDDLGFAYKHYGPYSEELASAAHAADLLGYLSESEHQANWGGTYSIFTVSGPNVCPTTPARAKLATEAAAADAIELELAATAVFLARAGCSDAWAETARRKPEKADQGRIERAKILYRTLAKIDTPVRLPSIG